MFQWRERLGRITVQNQSLPRQKQVRNLAEIRTVGILYDATDREVFEYVNDVVKRLRAEMKKVYTLGFINSRDERDMLSSRLGFDFFNRKCLDFYLRPKSPVVRNFMAEPFDLLIDLNVERLWPLEYIMRCSRASFKVGLSPTPHSPHDLSFQIPFPEHGMPYGREQKLRLMSQLIVNIRKYLHAI
ncbi:MAG: hypothetical protein NZM65_05155 [Flavobacteriales bacterium]|nr:hypothetical protein [Flavobacteriales bacterium]MDW8410060.1 hypothetical protein [Flavobacteriales bacterium]